MYILQTKNLIKKFGGVHAVDAVSISVPTGEITGLVGPNGSGKTTLINLISGLITPTDGAIVIAETERKKIIPSENVVYGVTRTFQQVRLFEQMSVLDNLLVVTTERDPFSALFEKHGEYHLNKVDSVLRLVGLYEKREDMAADLSYGQRKLLEIARAIAVDASIVLFDEPFAGLFPEIIKKVEEIILHLKNEGKTIILVEHNMAIIRKLCDYLFVMDSGKLLSEGVPEDVLSRRDVIEAYLGE